MAAAMSESKKVGNLARNQRIEALEIWDQAVAKDPRLSDWSSGMPTLVQNTPRSNDPFQPMYYTFHFAQGKEVRVTCEPTGRPSGRPTRVQAFWYDFWYGPTRHIVKVGQIIKPQSVLLTLHVGDPAMDGLVDVVCMGMSGDELATVHFDVNRPVHNLKAAICQKLKKHGSSVQLLFPDGRLLDDLRLTLGDALQGLPTQNNDSLAT